MVAISGPTSTSPTPERARRGQVEPPTIDDREFRPYWRSVAQIDKLLREKVITPREWRAAQRFRALFEIAHRGDLSAMAWDKTYLDDDCRRRSLASPDQHRLTALRHLDEMRAQFGAVAFTLVIMICVDNSCWSQIGRRFRIDPKTARSWTIAALRALAAD
jgi:hypothetical protein